MKTGNNQSFAPIKDTLRLSALPLIGLLSLLLAWMWARQDIALLQDGARVQGTIGAVLKIRPLSSDLVDSIDSRTEALLADGRRIVFDSHDHVVEVILIRGIDGDEQRQPVMEKWKELVRIASQEGIDEILRFLERQSRVDGPEQVVGLIKNERARGMFGMFQTPDELVARENDIVAAYGTDGDPVEFPCSVMEVTVWFEELMPESVRSPESGRRYHFEAQQNGEVINFSSFPDKRQEDFVLFQESYFGEIRPLVFFEKEGKSYVFRSHVGMLKEQLPAFKLFKHARVVYMPDNPERAMMLLDFSAIEGASEHITWMSAIAGAVFSRWMYPMLLSLIGLACIGGGLVFASLALWPHPEAGFHRKANAGGNSDDVPA